VYDSFHERGEWFTIEKLREKGRGRGRKWKSGSAEENSGKKNARFPVGPPTGICELGWHDKRDKGKRNC